MQAWTRCVDLVEAGYTDDEIVRLLSDEKLSDETAYVREILAAVRANDGY